jgi:hypothetical protein
MTVITRGSLFRPVSGERKTKKFGPNQHRKLMDRYFVEKNNKKKEKLDYNQRCIFVPLSSFHQSSGLILLFIP